MELRDAVICEPIRTAVGRAGGMYRDVSVVALALAITGAMAWLWVLG